MRPYQFKDRHPGESVLILGNGPSLGLLEPDRLTIPTIGIHRSWRKMTSPYHVILRQPRYWGEIQRGEWKPNVIFTLAGTVNWNTNAAMHNQTVWIPFKNIRKNIQGYGRLSFDLERGCHVSNAGVFAVEVALWLGFTKVHLIGYDLGEGEGHFCDDDSPEDRWRPIQRELMQIAADQLNAERRDVTVRNLNPASTVRSFPFGQLEELY